VMLYSLFFLRDRNIYVRIISLYFNYFLYSFYHFYILMIFLFKNDISIEVKTRLEFAASILITLVVFGKSGIHLYKKR